MPKPSKSPDREFMAKRRQAIEEMARKRSKKERSRDASVSATSGGKIVTPVSLPTGPPSQG